MKLIDFIAKNCEWDKVAKKGDHQKICANNIRRAINMLPSGCGFDNGTRIDITLSGVDRVILETSFHHMNENGYYTVWTHHTIAIKPQFFYDFDIYVSGKNTNDIKDYIIDVFRDCLSEEISE